MIRPGGPSALGILAAGSLLLTLGLAVGWAQSHQPGRLRVLAADGRLVLISMEISEADYAARVTDGKQELVRYLRAVGGPPATFAGVEYKSGNHLHRQGRSLPYRFTLASAPFPLLMVPAMLPACLWITVRVVRRKRATVGRCSSCGYDLRATPDRCPECGTEVATRGAA